MKARKLGSPTTGREMYWNDVDVISLYKNKSKFPGKNGKERFEPDRDVLHRMIEFYVKNNPNPPNPVPVSTYPQIQT